MTAAVRKKSRRHLRDRFELMDGIILFFLLIMAILILFPMLNVLALSLATQKEAAENPLMMFPTQPTIDNFYRLFQDPKRLLKRYVVTNIKFLLYNH